VFEVVFYLPSLLGWQLVIHHPFWVDGELSAIPFGLAEFFEYEEL
jgi:hypothetical protein